MANLTPNLGLFKYDETTDADVQFSFQQALNDNWDILDDLDLLPDQTNKNGYLLATDGTNPYWGETSEIYPVVETYVNGTSWYRVYSDGWCEQGGIYGGTNALVNFVKPFIDTNYTVTNSLNTTSSNTCLYSATSHTNKTTESVTFPNSGGVSNCSWQACGYIEV